MTVILATVGLLVTASPAHAAEVTTTVDGITYVADDTNVSAGATITGYTSTGGRSVTIPDTVTIGGTSYRVTAIGKYAFYNSQLTEVTIGNNVTTIGDSAFVYNRLTQVTFGDAVTTIGTVAFYGNGLTQVTLGDAVTSIGNSAFAYNPLTQVTLGDAVTTIGPSAFEFNQLAQVTIGDAVTSIGAYAFAHNRLTQVAFGDAVTSIGDSAFAHNRLTQVAFGDAVTSIGASAFASNAGLTEVTFTGAAPTSIVATESPTPSLGDPVGLVVYYPYEYDVSVTPGGYTTPLWHGYSTQPMINVYTVTFDSAGGSPVAAATVNESDPATEPTGPTRAGYTFTGWYTDEDATDAYDFEAPVTADLTLYAGWTISTYSVTFDTDEGNTIAPVTVEHGDRATAPADPTRDGYTFTGWYTDAAATDAYDFDAPVTWDVTLYAGWAINEYTVTFESVGGTVVTAVTVNEGDPVPAPAEPTRDGYEFTGWHTDAAATVPYDFTTAVNENATLYAGWEINEYTITFDTGAGTTVAPVKVKYGEPATAPADPTRDGYAFTGWYAEEDATEAYDFTSPVTGHVTLYAGWDKAAVEVPPAVTPPGTAMLPTTGGVFDPWLPLAALLLLAAGLSSIALRRFKQKRAR
ncbi:InlB B-repeat-containing protein [Leucobacter albus]|uniref:InlB B-repeat-containing protein n=1 Tax=Leucobacter albus TaxID=272210 RepID=UPI0036D41ADD